MRYICAIVFLLSSIAGFAQQPAGTVEMADAFREDGKIYVVLAVVLILLIGLFLYMITIDNKIRKLEKDKNKDA